MRERPILFSAPMVLAILSGAKTMTRRVLKVQPISVHDSSDSWEMPHWKMRSGEFCSGCPLESGPPGSRPFRTFEFDPGTDARLFYAHCKYGAVPKGKTPKWAYLERTDKGWSESELIRICPYGMPGSHLWVREAWHPSNHVPYGTKADYLADTPDATGEGFFKWKPSIFMPRWASRITLEITGVRVERLQEISEADAKAEGIEHKRLDNFPGVKACHCPATGWTGRTAYQTFANLWGHINGPDSWAANPWVWVIEFKRIGGDA